MMRRSSFTMLRLGSGRQLLEPFGAFQMKSDGLRVRGDVATPPRERRKGLSKSQPWTVERCILPSLSHLWHFQRSPWRHQFRSALQRPSVLHLATTDPDTVVAHGLMLKSTPPSPSPAPAPLSQPELHAACSDQGPSANPRLVCFAKPLHLRRRTFSP